MTNIQRDGKPQSSFSQWVRCNSRLDSFYECVTNHDIDWIWHCYLTRNAPKDLRRVQHIMLIEEKSHAADLSDAQRDVMWFIHQALEYVDKIGSLKFQSAMKGDKVRVRYWGYHKLRYEGDDIAVADKVWWDNHLIDLEQLENILRFELSPKTLTPIDSRSHHSHRNLPLFDKGLSP